MLTTDQSIPAPKDGEEVVNSEEWIENVTKKLSETLSEQQDIDLELKLWKDYLLREK